MVVPDLSSEAVLELSLALLLAVRCKQEDAARQILSRIYHLTSEDQARRVMNRLIYLIEPQERDWLRDLC